MKRMRWIALLLAVVLLFTGCSKWDWNELLGEIGAQTVTPFSEMKYTRPDMDKMEQALQTCCENSKTETDAQVLVNQALEFYRLYNSFYTNYNLASIYYFRDMTDSQWEAEYSFCMENTSVAEAGLEELFSTLADCPLKEELEKTEAFGPDFFDAYEGEVLWDETFTSLMNREAELKEQYYELCTQAQEEVYYSDAYFSTYGQQMAQVYVDLIALRQEVAQYLGYEDYPTFAYDYYHYRDYTPSQAQAYLTEIGRELAPLYRQVESRTLEGENQLCSQNETFSYVERASKKMGGAVQQAFILLRQAGLYDITYSDRKYDGSFEIYLTDYAAPFVFVNPSGTQYDKLTFAHEFGHFCQDYATGGNISGIDVAEVFSQGMEYLSLSYGGASSALQQLKMRDCLRIYIEQAAYALFEQQVYQLNEEELTVENVQALYEQIGRSFGFDSWDWDSRDFVLIGHFFTDPMYIVSYVVSNDAAFQLYQLEQAQAGSGLALLERELTTEKQYFLEFVQEAGLQSPFLPGRMASVRQTLEGILK